ncbi:hypothetical protein Tco_0241008 [Tanacetum coccineum]
MVEATSKFQNLLKIGMLIWGEADSKTSPKRSLRRKLFKKCCMIWGEVNPTHAYYNGSCTNKDTEDPSRSTSFKTRRTQKTSSALEELWKTLFVLYLYLIGTLLVPSCFVIFDLEPLSLSFDFVFMSEIFKSLSFSLDRLCHLAIFCLDNHAHTLHHLETLLTISLDRFDILKEDLVYQSLRKCLSLILELF